MYYYTKFLNLFLFIEYHSSTQDINSSYDWEPILFG